MAPAATSQTEAGITAQLLLTKAPETGGFFYGLVMDCYSDVATCDVSCCGDIDGVPTDPRIRHTGRSASLCSFFTEASHPDEIKCGAAHLRATLWTSSKSRALPAPDVPS